jgi:hypothetical protein
MRQRRAGCSNLPDESGVPSRIKPFAGGGVKMRATRPEIPLDETLKPGKVARVSA